MITAEEVKAEFPGPYGVVQHGRWAGGDCCVGGAILQYLFFKKTGVKRFPPASDNWNNWPNADELQYVMNNLMGLDITEALCQQIIDLNDEGLHDAAWKVFEDCQKKA